MQTLKSWFRKISKFSNDPKINKQINKNTKKEERQAVIFVLFKRL